MTDRVKLLRVLNTLCGDDDVVVIHSSLAHFSFTSQVSKWDFLYVLRGLVQEGKTVLLPAFTFSFCRTGDFNAAKPSEVGVLADWALELPEFERTSHPIYSYAVAGPKKIIF